jgi:hypothetical protein
MIKARALSVLAWVVTWIASMAAFLGMLAAMGVIQWGPGR